MPQPQSTAPPGGYQTSGLFDEVGIESAPVGTQPCPGCRAPIPMHAVVCVQCGYNLKLGRKMETMRVGADGEVIGPGSVVDTVLARAARSLEDDKLEEWKKTHEGLPWWAYLVMLLGVVGFLSMMMMIPQDSAMMVAGGGLIFIGWLVCVYSTVCILITAFRESPLQGILCLLCGPYQLVYIIMRWDQCAGYFFMNLGGSVIVGLGVGVIILGGWMAGSETAMQPLTEHAAPLAQLWLASWRV